MSNWIHRLFNPHCPHCEVEAVNETVEILKHQLELANVEKAKLLQTVIDLTHPIVNEVKSDAPEPLPLLPKYMPFSVRRQLLEQEDKVKAQVLAERKKEEDQLRASKQSIGESIKDLESELGILPVESLDIGKENVS